MNSFPKTALLTGASGAIGAAIATRLARENVALALVARRAAPLEELRRRLEASGARAIVIAADVADLSSVPDLVREARSRLGGLDLLVNNAGLESFGHLHEQELSEVEATVSVNLTGPLALMRHAIAHMLEDGGGVIVNVCSTAGLVGTPWGVVYAATKAGLLAATASVRMEYEGTGVTASAICPGFVLGGGMHEEQRKLAGEAPALVGTTTLDEVAEAVVDAIRGRTAEVIVNSRPLRPLLPFARLFPSFGATIVRGLVGDYMKKLADERRRRLAG